MNLPGVVFSGMELEQMLDLYKFCGYVWSRDVVTIYTELKMRQVLIQFYLTVLSFFYKE